MLFFQPGEEVFSSSDHEVHIARYFIDFVAEDQLVVEAEKVAEHFLILSHRISLFYSTTEISL
jgi:hypothetical protein